MTTPKACRPGLGYGQILLVSIALLTVLSSKVNAQCTVSSPSPETPATGTTKNGTNTTTPPKAVVNPAPTTSPTTASTPTPSPTPYPLSIKEVKVANGAAGLGDKVVVTVNCLKEELARQRNTKNGVPPQDLIDPKTFVLFLDKVEIKKLHPYFVDEENGEFHFKLTRDTQSRDAWQDFLARPKDPIVQVNASVGPEGKAPLKDAKPFSLRVYWENLLYLAIVLFLATIVGFLIAAKKTSIIRDTSPPNPVGGSQKRPYSLARAQVAWWFFIILGSFLFIALVTWDLDTITSSSLVLLGIGTGTALGAAMVDANKKESSDSELGTLKPREAKLVALIAELKTKIKGGEGIALGADPNLVASLASSRTELATLEAELEQVRSQVNDAASGLEKPVSEGVIKDILSDVNGVTFHRFQIIVWTVVLGLIFIYSVWTSLTMPQFSDTLLALMGISAGTYIGFKIPEQQTNAADAPNMPGGVNAADNVEADGDTDPQSDEEGC